MIDPPPPPPPTSPPPPPAPPAVQGTGRGRRRIVIAIVAIVAVIAAATTAVVLVAGHSDTPAARAKSTPSTRLQRQSQPTVPEEVMLHHADRNGRLDLEGALELFSYAFAPLPGVTLPTGLPDNPADWTDPALVAILNNYSELTVAQRQVVLSYLTIPPAAGTSASSIAHRD